MVRTVTNREPRWTDQDRAEILALSLYRSWLCPLCHGLLEDCTSHEDTGPQFVVRKIRCRATDARLAANEDGKNTDRPDAVLTSVTKKE